MIKPQRSQKVMIFATRLRTSGYTENDRVFDSNFLNRTYVINVQGAGYITGLFGFITPGT